MATAATLEYPYSLCDASPPPPLNSHRACVRVWNACATVPDHLSHSSVIGLALLVRLTGKATVQHATSRLMPSPCQVSPGCPELGVAGAR